MGVFLPAAAFGNSEILVTMGRAGEVMGLFYPNIDFAQNARQCMPAIFVGHPKQPMFSWLFEDHWESRLDFDGTTNILHTHLTSRLCNLSVTITDLAHPREPALVRRFVVQASTDSPPLKIYQYCNFSLGDVDRKNAVHFDDRQGVMIQHFRDISLAVAASRPFEYQCGKVQAGGDSRTKWDMGRGQLSGQEQDIGDVDFALGVAVDPSKEPRAETLLVFALGRTQEEAIARAVRLRQASFPTLMGNTVNRCRSWLSCCTSLDDGEFAAGFQRALLSLRDLCDESEGAIIAAPEFDPAYQMCGGYGYCWPRDAAEAAEALALAGHPEMAESYFHWAARTQLENGHWYQRYWTTGQRASAWCVYHDFHQLDQTCHTVFAIARHALRLEGEARERFVENLRPTVHRAVEAIRATVGPEGLHEVAADVWEVFRGSFTYTNAAVYGALRAAEQAFGIADELSQKVKRAVLERLWLEEQSYFARGITHEGKLDTTCDSSILGVFDPFGLLDLTDARERQMAARTLASVEHKLGVDVHGGRAILRYEGDPYLFGAAGCVNTLWAARAHLRLALVAARRRDLAAADSHAEAARSYMRTALANTNPVGQLPELISRGGYYRYWAAPHAWASALFVQCVLMLRRLRELRGPESPELA